MIEQIAPIFLFVLIGYLFKIFKEDISLALTEFVIYFSLPALALSKIRILEFNDVIYKIIAISYLAMFVAFLLSLTIGKFLKLSRRDLATFMVVSIFGNTSFVGFSYIESLYSMKEVVYALVYDQLGSFIALLTFGVAIISWGGNKKKSYTQDVLKQIFLSPPLIAIVVAIYFHGTQFPPYLEGILDKLQATLIPLVTIIVGMKLELKALVNYFKENVIALSIKMFIVPFVMFGIMYAFFDMSQIWTKVTFLEIAMPPMTMATVYAIKGGLNKTLAINTLALGIIVSFLSIVTWNVIIN
ncbi:MAG: AEC family transporter [Epsilonproteobacteria bacterium]|nr:AEC family transporter [Campylobacterota bacterium]